MYLVDNHSLVSYIGEVYIRSSTLCPLSRQRHGTCFLLWKASKQLLDPGCDQVPVLFPFVLSPHEVFFVFTRAVHPTIIDASKSVDPETGALDTLDRMMVTGAWLT